MHLGLRRQRPSPAATVRIAGPRRLYALDTAPLREVDAWLAQFRGFWLPKLEALATEVARGKRKKKREVGNRE